MAEKAAPPATVKMTKEGQTADVNNNESVQIMQEQGWEIVPDKPVKSDDKGAK